jgi:putative restriction endonuclease
VDYGMLALDRSRIEKAAADCGFELTPELQNDGLVLRSARFPEYVRVQVEAPGRFLVTPSSGVILEGNVTGAHECAHGYDALYEVLLSLAAKARTFPNRVADAFRARTASMPNTTEIERLVVQRVGQQIFREALLDFWQGRCPVTGLAIPGLLRASHIKPWAVCNDDNERLDVYNGLLLAPQVDALFDGGWVTFQRTGFMLVSDELDDRALSTLGLRLPTQIVGLSARHQSYLDFHRRNVFGGGSVIAT